MILVFEGAVYEMADEGCLLCYRPVLKQQPTIPIHILSFQWCTEYDKAYGRLQVTMQLFCSKFAQPWYDETWKLKQDKSGKKLIWIHLKMSLFV